MIPSVLAEYNEKPVRIHSPRILLKNMVEDLSDLISRRMKELGLTKAELARRAGISRSYIGNIMNRTAPTQSGSYVVSPEVARSLAKAIEVPDAEVAAAMNYIGNGQSSAAQALANRLAEHIMSGGYTDLEDEGLRDAFEADMRLLAETMLKRKLEEQEKGSSRNREL